MKLFSITFLILLTLSHFSSAQSSEQMINKCITLAGTDSKYLKDYRIQLGRPLESGDLRFKAKMSLWKDMKYRFTMCCTDDSQSQLILNVKDETDRIVLTSIDRKSGKTYSTVDFVCNKSGIYMVSYDFTNDQQGSGVGVVCLVK